MKLHLISLGLLLTACGAPVPPPPSTPSTPTPSSSVARTPNFDISATMVPASVVGTPSTTATMTLKLAMILVGDEGKQGAPLGCGDSLSFIEKQVPSTVSPLTASLTELLAIRTETYGSAGAANTLANSTLTLTDASLAPDGTATVRVRGEIVLGGVCDNPRVKGQIEETARAVPGVKQVVVELNGSATAWTCAFDQSGLPPCDVPLTPAS